MAALQAGEWAVTLPNILEFHPFTLVFSSALKTRNYKYWKHLSKEVLHVFHKHMIFLKHYFSNQVPAANHLTSHGVSWPHSYFLELHANLHTPQASGIAKVVTPPSTAPFALKSHLYFAAMVSRLKQL